MLKSKFSSVVDFL